MTRRKWLIAALTWMAAWGWTSCSSDDENLQDDTRAVKVNFTVAGKQGFEPSSKAVKTGWAAGDQIRVFFKPGDGTYASSTHVMYQTNGFNFTLLLTYDGSTWNETWTLFDGAAISDFGTSGKFAAVHYRVASGKTIGVGSVYTNDLSIYTDDNPYNGGEVLLHSGNYTVSGETMNLGTLTMSLGQNDYCQISIPKSKVADLAAGWKLAVLRSSYGTGTYPTDPTTHVSEIGSFTSPLLRYEEYFSITNYAGTKPYYATGVENGDDISFLFRNSGDDTEKYVFYLTNETDVYTLVVDRGYDSGTDTYQKTIENGKAYRLTSGTWTKE